MFLKIFSSIYESSESCESVSANFGDFRVFSFAEPVGFFVFHHRCLNPLDLLHQTLEP